MNEAKKAALKEKAIRELERRHKDKRDSLVKFIEYFFMEEHNRPFQANWHYELIEKKLKKVLAGEVNRLIINIPPGSGKTELITKCFPVWAMGNNPRLQFIATGYSANLTQNFGSQARDYYNSKTYRNVFPRRPDLKEDMNTKALWKNDLGGQYLATGVGGSITGNRANIFIIDDPIKPDEALSEVKREAVNRWYDNTVLSRLFDPGKDAVIIIMQRVHENDLCGYLKFKENEGGEVWDEIVLPAIATHDDNYRKQGDPLHPDRFPLESLEMLRRNDAAVFSTQYQQEPTNKEAQEFHEEFFRYWDEVPTDTRNFTIVDPGFKTKKENDPTCIMTVGFANDGKMYVLEYTNVKLQAADVITKVIYHLKKWKSEKVGVEAYQAQTVLAQFLKKEMREQNIHVPLDEVTQKGSKEQKIRKLDYPIRNGLIYWRRDMHELEAQLKTFPRGRHDDVIDAMQMAYSIYQIRPNLKDVSSKFKIKYDSMGRPVFNDVGTNPLSW